MRTGGFGFSAQFGVSDRDRLPDFFAVASPFPDSLGFDLAVDMSTNGVTTTSAPASYGSSRSLTYATNLPTVRANYGPAGQTMLQTLAASSQIGTHASLTIPAATACDFTVVGANLNVAGTRRVFAQASSTNIHVGLIGDGTGWVVRGVGMGAVVNVLFPRTSTGQNDVAHLSIAADGSAVAYLNGEAGTPVAPGSITGGFVLDQIGRTTTGPTMLIGVLAIKSGGLSAQQRAAWFSFLSGWISKVYYVAAAGNDSLPGFNGTQAWASLSKLSSSTILRAGDTIALKGGDIFRITAQQSFGIDNTILDGGLWGTGYANVHGSTKPTNWASLGGGIWSRAETRHPYADGGNGYIFDTSLAEASILSSLNPAIANRDAMRMQYFADAGAFAPTAAHRLGQRVEEDVSTPTTPALGKWGWSAGTLYYHPADAGDPNGRVEVAYRTNATANQSEMSAALGGNRTGAILRRLNVRYVDGSGISCSGSGALIDRCDVRYCLSDGMDGTGSIAKTFSLCFSGYCGNGANDGSPGDGYSNHGGSVVYADCFAMWCDKAGFDDVVDAATSASQCWGYGNRPFACAATSATQAAQTFTDCFGIVPNGVGHPYGFHQRSGNVTLTRCTFAGVGTRTGKSGLFAEKTTGAMSSPITTCDHCDFDEFENGFVNDPSSGSTITEDYSRVDADDYSDGTHTMGAHSTWVTFNALSAPAVPDEWGLVIDAWDFDTVTPLGAEPNESASRAMYRAVASVADKFLADTTYAATGDVRHTRPDEEPYGEIARVRGRRSIRFVQNPGGQAAYLTLSNTGLQGAVFKDASVGNELRILMGTTLLGGATRLGDGTIFDRAGHRGVANAGATEVTLIIPAATTNGETRFPLPSPEEGRVRLWDEMVFNGALWKVYYLGKEIPALSTIAPVGAIASDAGAAMTIGGRVGNGLDSEMDFLSIRNGAGSVLEDVSKWRWDTPVSHSLKPAGIHHRNLCDIPKEDGLFHIFEGTDGGGLRPYDVTLLTDNNVNGEWFRTWVQSTNKLAFVRVSGITTRLITNQNVPRYATRTGSNGAFINASGASFAAVGTEHRLGNGHTAVANTLLKGIIFGGPMAYGAEYQNEGTPLMLYGRPPADGTEAVTNTIVKDCGFYFTPDNAIAGWGHNSNVLVLNCVSMAQLRISDHGESPNHPFICLIGDGSTKWSIVGAVFPNSNQRTPAVLGSHGFALTRLDAKAEMIAGYIRPQNDGTKNYTGQVVGQANNEPGPNTGSSHISNRQVIFEANRNVNNDATPLAMTQPKTVTGSGVPVNDTTVHAVGNYLTAGCVESNDPTKDATRPKWGSGGQLRPTDQDDLYDSIVTEGLANQPAFAAVLLAAYQTGVVVEHNRYVSNPGHINPNTAPNVAALDALLNPATTEWSLAANAALEPLKFTGSIRSWASIHPVNGPAIEAMIAAGARVPGPAMWAAAGLLYLEAA